LKCSQASTLQLITTFHFLSFVGYVGAVPGTRGRRTIRDEGKIWVDIFREVQIPLLQKVFSTFAFLCQVVSHMLSLQEIELLLVS